MTLGVVDVYDMRPEVVRARRLRFFVAFARQPELDAVAYAERFGVDVRTIERWRRDARRRKPRREKLLRPRSL